MTGGYAYLHRPAPMLYFTTDDRAAQPRTDLARNADAFNTIMTPAGFASELPRQFTEMACEGSGGARICLYRRPGACSATGGPSAINAVLRRTAE